MATMRHTATRLHAFLLLLSVLSNCSSDDASSVIEVQSEGFPVEVSAIELLGDGFFDIHWRLAVPNGSDTALTNIEGETTSFTPDRRGFYVVDVQGTDGNVTASRSRTYELTAQILAVSIQAPQTVAPGSTVSALAVPQDRGGKSYSLIWRVGRCIGCDDVPFGLDGIDTISFIAAEPGEYHIGVHLTTEDGDSVSDEIIVEARP